MFKFENVANQSHLYINDVIGEDIDIKSFREELNYLEDGNELIIHVNSVGGSVFEGWAIANAIREESKKRNTVCIIEGLSASIATAISIACNEVRIYSNALMMIHNASAFVYGSKEDLLKQVEVLSMIDNQLAEAYETKSNGKYNKEHFLDLMRAETWLSSQEAYELGLVDLIADKQVELVACSDISKLKYKDVSKLESLVNELDKANQEKDTKELLSLYHWLDDFNSELFELDLFDREVK